MKNPIKKLMSVFQKAFEEQEDEPVQEYTESQKARILSHLLSGKSITPMEALNQYGCFRLSARIYDLIDDGYNIKKVMREVNGKRFAEYSYEKEYR